MKNKGNKQRRAENGFKLCLPNFSWLLQTGVLIQKGKPTVEFLP